jgi:TetR/AcrR family transcriptional regulator, transcriptional repressor for nem operon
MPKSKSHTRDELIDKAMWLFWWNGFEATSMDDLVKATGVSRHGIYQESSGKEGLFLACLDNYASVIVTPAFEGVERDGADIESIRTYFELQIRNGEQAGLPGPGCLMANSLTEVAPRNAKIASAVAKHNSRLLLGFNAALSNTAAKSGRPVDQGEIAGLAHMLVAFTNGLWSMSRSVDSAAPLTSAAHSMIALLKGRIQSD